MFPQCNKEQATFLLVIDNLRYDQWKVIEPFLLDDFKINEEDLFFSILPTATQYGGMMMMMTGKINLNLNSYKTISKEIN